MQIICRQCGAGFNLQDGKCYRSCDGSCVSQTSDHEDCKCECALPVEIVDGKCTTTCANASYAFYKNSCQLKCQDCEGYALIINNNIVQISCPDNKSLVSGGCEDNKEDKIVLIFAVLSGACVLVLLIFILAVYIRKRVF